MDWVGIECECQLVQIVGTKDDVNKKNEYDCYSLEYALNHDEITFKVYAFMKKMIFCVSFITS